MRELVLLPGWSMPPDSFASLLPVLAPRWRVTVLPLPVADTLPDMAAAALAAAPARAVWLGWSLGGMVAAQAAVLQPARVAALVAVATSLRFVAAPDWPRAMPAAEFAAFSAALAADADATLARFQGLVTRGAATARDDLRQLRALAASTEGGAGLAPAATVAGLARTLAVLGSADLRAIAATLSCPNLWLYGERDALVPAAVAADVQRCLPLARIERLAGASHAPFLSAPATVTAALERFLPECP